VEALRLKKSDGAEGLRDGKKKGERQNPGGEYRQKVSRATTILGESWKRAERQGLNSPLGGVHHLVKWGGRVEGS